MRNKIEEVLEILRQPIDASGMEELLTQYINQIEDKKDFEEIFGAGFEAVDDGEVITTDLISLALENNFSKFLCAALDKYPELAQYTQRENDDEFIFDTLAHAAAKKEMEDVCLKVLEIDPHMVYERNHNDESFVSICAEKGMEDICIKALHIEQELAEEQFGSLNLTIGHIAAENSMETVVLKSLTANPKSALVTDNSGKTYLHYAAENLLNAVCLRSLEVCPEAAKVQDEMMKETFLHIAASFKDNHDMEMVLIKALETNPELAKIQNFLDETFLHNAATNGMEKVLNKALEINPKLFEVLDVEGNTPLHEAAYAGQDRILLNALMNAPKDLIETKNDDGQTCMEIYKELQEKEQSKESAKDKTDNSREKN